MSEQRITLKETSTEYLLFIHASQKERAKRIQGRDWDGQRRCWVYPRTPDTFNAIVGEFGEDLDDQTDFVHAGPRYPQRVSPTLGAIATSVAVISGDSPTTSQEVNPLRIRLDELEATNLAQRLELEHAAESVRALTEQLTSVRLENEHLHSQFATSRGAGTTDRLIAQLKDVERLLAEQSSANRASRTRILGLESELQACQTELSQMVSAVRAAAPKTKPRKYLIDLAIDAASRDAHFAGIVRDRDIDASLALTLQGELSQALAYLMPGTDETTSLHDLLTYARAHEVLTQDELDLAHVVRKQRNVVAHPGKSQHSTKVRVLLVLFAAALLWPELTKRLVLAPQART